MPCCYRSYRMKGVLSIRGQEDKFVFQGIHMLFDGQPMECVQLYPTSIAQDQDQTLAPS